MYSGYTAPYNYLPYSRQTYLYPTQFQGEEYYLINPGERQLGSFSPSTPPPGFQFPTTPPGQGQFGPPTAPPGQGQFGPPTAPPGQGQFGPPTASPGQGLGPEFGAPTAPPPSFVPQLQEVEPFAVDPGSIRRCLFRYTFIRLRGHEQFWFYPTFVGRTSVSGWRWTGRRWVISGISLREIRAFTCI